MKTTRNVSIALKNGRKMSRLRLVDAAKELGIDERTLSRYETLNPRDVVKQEDPALIASAIRLYDDSTIGLVYLWGHPVVIELTSRMFGKVIGAAPDAPGTTPHKDCNQCQFITVGHACQPLRPGT